MNNFKLHKDFENKIPVFEDEEIIVLLNPIKELNWFIVVPKALNAKNILDLKEQDRAKFLEKVCKVADFGKSFFKPDQVNICMLGNKTPMLHCHVIMRFEGDCCWPMSPFEYKFERYNKIEEFEVIKGNLKLFLES